MKFPLNRLYDIAEDGTVTSYQGLQPKVIKPRLNEYGYERVNIHTSGKLKTYYVHKLVWFTFKGSAKGLQVDHIDGNKRNNHIDNLQLLEPFENTIKSHLDNSDKPIGVTYHKKAQKYQASIRLDGKKKYLGLFDTQKEAGMAYYLAFRERKDGRAG